MIVKCPKCNSWLKCNLTTTGIYYTCDKCRYDSRNVKIVITNNTNNLGGKE